MDLHTEFHIPPAVVLISHGGQWQPEMMVHGRVDRAFNNRFVGLVGRLVSHR